MRVLIISGKDGLKRIEVENEADMPLYLRAVAIDVEAHNSLHDAEDHWSWYEEGSENDAALAPEKE